MNERFAALERRLRMAAASLAMMESSVLLRTDRERIMWCIDQIAAVADRLATIEAET